MSAARQDEAENGLAEEHAMTNHFAELARINVNEHVEKKGNLSYLSWPWAVDQILRADPTANWTYGEPVKFGETMMVNCTVTAFGIARTMQLPVMDHRNKAIAKPDAFQVNTAMQRCLVKAIALHGLGLYIYAGEDLPAGEEPTEDADKKNGAKSVVEKLTDSQHPNHGAQVNLDAFNALDKDTKDFVCEHAKTLIGLFNTHGDMAGYVKAQEYDTETSLALWSQLPSLVRSAIKKQQSALRLAEQG